MFASVKWRAWIFGAGSVFLLTAGAAVAARPLVHLVRRTHAKVTARSEWVRWVKAGRDRAGVGEPAGWMTIPTAGIDTIVLWGDTRHNLQRYPCLSARSVSFAQREVVKVVAAHRDTHFRSLGRIAIGDRVSIVLKDLEVLEYRVCDIEVVPREMAVMRVAEKDGSDWLVLMTCYPLSFVGPAPDRLLVWARPSYYSPPPARDRRGIGRAAFASCRGGGWQGRGVLTAQPLLYGEVFHHLRDASQARLRLRRCRSGEECPEEDRCPKRHCAAGQGGITQGA
jgi:sortase A